MNSITRIALAGAACIMGFAFASSPSLRAASEGSSAGSDIAGPAPSPSHVWMSGHWAMEGGQWKWIAAHWELPPSRSAIWIAGHWISQGGNWVWVNGAWNVTDGAQAQAEPPHPPGQASPGDQAVPTPSSVAPTIDGQYAPGAVVRAGDQVPVTTDYGPVEYDTVYPGYYWTYDPWFWGPYPWGFLNWGPGFYYGGYWHGGYGRGGYGHWGGGYAGRGAGSWGGYFRGSAGHFGGGHFH
jgi:hypothetical protein